MSVEEKATAVFTELVATAGLVDPFSRFERLRSLGPVVPSVFGHLVTGHAEAIEILRHPHMNATASLTFGRLTDQDWTKHPLLALFGQSLFFDSGEVHAGVRRVVANRFTPPAIGKLRPMIDEVVCAHSDVMAERLASGESVDVVAEFARPIPIAVACNMLDLPLEDAARLTELLLQAQLTAASVAPTEEELDELIPVGHELTAYLDNHLATAPQNSLMGEIASADLTSHQARGLALILLGAGFETTSNLIANCVNLVLRHDSLASLDLHDPAIISALIDETLRYEAPVQLSARANDGSDPITIGNTTIPTGVPVLILLGAAGRDPNVYADPDTFSPTRFLQDTPAAPLSFGSGIHHCLGHHLARQQAEAALAALLPLLVNARAIDREADWRPLLQSRSLASLRITLREDEHVVNSSAKNIRKLQRKRRRQTQTMMIGVGTAKLGHGIARVVTPKSKREASDAAASAKQAGKAADRFGEMRGVMMKLGQLFSYTAPGLSEGAAAALSALQDSVDPMKPGEAEGVLRAEFGRGVDELFANFDSTPIAAASIGQVHRATLHDGRHVAVKVQYVGIADAVSADLQELERNQKLLSRFVMKNLDVKQMSKELTDRFSEELDYRIEAANQREFAKRYAGHPFIKIPAVVDELSARVVLTTEWVDGLKWNEFALKATQEQKNDVGEMLTRFINAGLRRYGVFQADAHPGNFIVDPDGKWLAVLDFGLVKRLSPQAAREARIFQNAVFGISELTPMQAAEKIGYFPKAHKVSAERFADYVAPTVAMVGKAGVITHELYEKAIRNAYDPRGGFTDVIRQANGPAETILQDRIAYGNFALLAGLRAEGDWPGIRDQYTNDGPVTTPLGQVEQEWFIRRRR